MVTAVRLECVRWVKEITKAPIDGTLEEGLRCPLPGTAPRRETHSLNDHVLEGEGDK